MKDPKESRCTCYRSGGLIHEPEFECEVHGVDTSKMTTEEHAAASARAVLGLPYEPIKKEEP